MKSIYRVVQILIFAMLPGVSHAQFYDDADDILFYVNTKNPLFCIVVNFDGEKATYFNHTYQFSRNKIADLLNSDELYFEKMTESALYNMRFTDRFSNPAYIFSVHRNGMYGNYYDSYVMEFSNNRRILTYKCYPQVSNPSATTRPSKTETYELVSKSDFITRGRRHR